MNWLNTSTEHQVAYNLTFNTALTTEWNYISGATSETNPRQVEFLVINNLLNDHTDYLVLTGELSFSWTGNAGSIPVSGVMFELKLGDLDFFPDAAQEIPDPESWGEAIPEPTSLVLLGVGYLLLFSRRRRINP